MVKERRLWLIYVGIVLATTATIAGLAVWNNVDQAPASITRHQVKAWVDVLTAWPDEPPDDLHEVIAACAGGHDPMVCRRLWIQPAERDFWQRPLRYRRERVGDEIRFEVGSDGPDGRPGTSDDIQARGVWRAKVPR